MNKTIQELIDQLDTSSDKKADAVIAQIAAQGPSAVKPLLAAAQDTSRRRIQKWSLQALGVMKVRKSAPLLMNALDDERMTVRLHALHGLRRMKYKKALPVITKLLKDESGGIRVNAIYALMEMGDAQLTPQIKKALNDPQWYIRQAACEACGVLEMKSTRVKLRQLSKVDPRKAVRTAAEEALLKLQE